MRLPPAPLLSLIIPCYMDAPHLAEGVEEVLKTLRQTRHSYELVLVNDCSPDHSAAVIDDIIRSHPEEPITCVTHPKNTGRGQAVFDGVKAARGEYAGFIDIDLEVHSRYIPSMVQALEDGADLVLANRIYKVGPGLVFRAVMSKSYHFLMRRMLGTALGDTEAGYKFFRRGKMLPVLEQVRDPGWFWDTEMVFRSHWAGLKIAHVPVLFLRRLDKASTVRVFRDSLDYMKKLSAFRKVARGQRAQTGPPA